MLQGLLKAITIAGSSGGSASDPFFSSVRLLMGFEDVNGSTGAPGMTDESSAAHGTATVQGTPSISTSQFKFGSSSLNNNSSKIRFANSADWNFGSGNFTVEMFVYPNSVTGSQFLFSYWLGSPFLSWVFFLNGAALHLSCSTTGSDFPSVFDGGTVSTGSWQHVCADFDGTKYRGYINGTMVASSTTLRTFSDQSSSGLVFAIGDDSSTGAVNTPFNGFIDEVRITKGVARYATDTSFTVPTSAFPRR